MRHRKLPHHVRNRSQQFARRHKLPHRASNHRRVRSNQQFARLNRVRKSSPRGSNHMSLTVSSQHPWR